MSVPTERALQDSRMEETIDFGEIVRLLWGGKWIIGGITVAITVLAVVVSLMLPNIYRAEALLAPSEQEGANGLSALAAQYGGLASLAGISLGGNQSDKTALGLEVLVSRKFLSDFIERRNLLVPVMAAKGWDAGSDQLVIDADIYDVLSSQWVRSASSPRNTVPSYQEAYEEFRGLLHVVQDSNSGFVVVAIEYYSPSAAKLWVDWLIEDLNAQMMQQDMSDANQAIDYLNAQIESTSIAGLRNVFFNLIEEQTKVLMLATLTDEYLLRSVDPAVVPELKARPKRALIVIASTVLGFFLSVIIVLIARSKR